MRYQGSEALNIDFVEGGEALEQAARPSFQVLPGGGLDARARKGVSAQFIANVRTVVVLAAVLIAIGLVRVAISSATVVALSNNSTLRSEVSDAKNLNDDLKIERAVLSSNSRIARIATQNYGMVLSSDAMTVEVGEAAEAEQAAAEEAQAAAEQAQQAADESAAAVAAGESAAQQAGDASYVLDPASYAASLLSADGDAAQSVAEGGAYCDVA
ncbi:MAG: cell division protein FtsL [Coriobacteriia bacterium]|nr:cell division protein FtsL [Coriobacteriia bacterium]